MDKAIKFTQTMFPRVFEDNPRIYFQLKRRKFIEMMRKYTELKNPNSSPTSLSQVQQQRSSNGFGGNNDESDSQENEDDEDVFDHQMELDDQLNMPPKSSDPHSSAMDLHNSIHMKQSTSMNNNNNVANAKSVAAKAKTLMDEIIIYGQELRQEFLPDPSKKDDSAIKQLNDAFALMAYDNPWQSPLAYLYEDRERAEMAERLNGAVLGKKHILVFN
jgi:Ran-binding protein 9/10